MAAGGDPPGAWWRPNRWRGVGALLVALALVLPLSSCEHDGKRVYDYALDAPIHRIEECIRGAADADRWRCYVDRDWPEVVTVAVFLWPLGAYVLAHRARGRRLALARLALEPLLAVASASYLYDAVSFADRLESGTYAAVAGLLACLAGWALELVALRRARRRPAPDSP